MLSLIISFTLAIITISTTQSLGGWSYVWGTLVFLLAQIAVGQLLKKKIMATQNEIQGVIQEGQRKLNIKMTQMQRQGGGNIKVMQKVLENEQAKFLGEALEATSKMEQYVKWSLLMKKQIATMRFQFNFQLKNNTKVDALMSKVLYLDPMIYAMRMAREYKKGEMEAFSKTYKKAKGRYKGEKGTIIFATYSWAMVKKGNIDEAIACLNLALKKSSNEVLQKNLHALQNGKIKQFSNAALGDMWYALYLEEVKQKVQKVRQRASKGGRPF
ncbi:MAG: hypothetical protein KAG98_05630 [Lentisphaeria bacterium]|nr:hypothetical protein [Lentisphaeria bacterium]